MGGLRRAGRRGAACALVLGTCVALASQAEARPARDAGASDPPARLDASRLAAPDIGASTWALVSPRVPRVSTRTFQPLPELAPSRTATLDDYASFDGQDLQLAVGLGTQAELGIAGVGRLLAQNLANRLFNPRELLKQNLTERPVATGVAVGVAVGAYVGWEGITQGRMGGSYSFDAGKLGLGISGWYDVRTGDWAGRARVDLSRLIDER